ncbi:MAG: Hsp20/alpha crystallin family protein [Anaerolineae bacterium]|jgi:HSP20 family protein
MLMRPFYRYRSPWSEMARLQREMDRYFNRSPRGSWWSEAAGYPAVNVWTETDAAIVTAELPGIDPESIDISVQDDTLTIRGSREREEVEGATYHRQERRFGSFARTVQVPFRVQGDEVNATFEKGVLRISLPRAEEDKPKRITVRAG